MITKPYRRPAEIVRTTVMLYALEEVLSVALKCTNYCNQPKADQWHDAIKKVWDEVYEIINPEQEP